MPIMRVFFQPATLFPPSKKGLKLTCWGPVVRGSHDPGSPTLVWPQPTSNGLPNPMARQHQQHSRHVAAKFLPIPARSARTAPVATLHPLHVARQNLEQGRRRWFGMSQCFLGMVRIGHHPLSWFCKRHHAHLVSFLFWR